MYVFSEMDHEAADAIDSWSYPAPYDFYDLDADPEDRRELLDSTNWPERWYAVREDDALVGFFAFDVEDDTVTVGLGLAPDRTGHGEGERFVEAGLAFAQGRYGVSRAELAVAAFNERAITVYERLGFERTRRYEQETNGGIHEFVELARPL